MRCRQVDRAMLHVDEQQVETGARHDLHDLWAWHGDDGTECRLVGAKQVTNTVEGMIRPPCLGL